MRIVAGGESGWSDPALLSHLGGVTATLVEAESPRQIVRAGRVLCAIAGALSVFLLWQLLRQALQPVYALFGAATAAVSPMLVSQAHYFAPDMIALALGLTSVLCLVRLTETDGPRWAVGLGGAVGLGVSAHYGGVLLVLLCATTPVVVPVRDGRAFRKQVGQAMLVAAITFAALNAPLLLSGQHLITGPWVQFLRIFRGDHVHLISPAHGDSFHLRETLWPGLTGPVVLAAAIGIACAIHRRRMLSTAARLLLLSGGLAFAIAELSPLKPLPGAERYMLAVLPALAFGAGLALQTLAGTVHRRSFQWGPVVTMAVVLAVPACVSVQIVRGLGDDTRLRADAWIAANAGRTLRAPYTSTGPPDVASLAAVDLEAARRGGVTHVATSSFAYDTFARGSRLANQHDYVYERHKRYQELFEYPYVEFRPDHPSFGWSHPTVRVLDIRAPRPPGRP